MNYMIETYHLYQERCLYVCIYVVYMFICRIKKIIHNHSQPPGFLVPQHTSDAWLQKVEGLSSSSANRELGWGGVGGGLNLLDCRTIRTTLPWVSFADLVCKGTWQFSGSWGFKKWKRERSCVISIIFRARVPSLLFKACPFFSQLSIWSKTEMSFKLFLLCGEPGCNQYFRGYVIIAS